MDPIDTSFLFGLGLQVQGGIGSRDAMHEPYLCAYMLRVKSPMKKVDHLLLIREGFRVGWLVVLSHVLSLGEIGLGGSGELL